MNKLLQTMHIRTRLMILSAIIFVGVTCLVIFSLVNLRSSMMQERSAKLVGLIDAAKQVAAHFHQLQVDGKLTEEQAQQQALEAIRYMRYEKTNYIFIYNPDYKRILFPVDPASEGKIFKDLQDKNGVYIVRDFVATAQKSGAGFVAYHFPRPGQTEALPKLSYVSYLPEWQWALGTGVYLDDVDEKFRAFAGTNIGLGVLMLAAISGIAVLISRSILAQLGGEPVYAVEVVTQVASGNLTMRANLRRDDTTSLLAMLQMMVQDLRQILLQVRHASESIDVAATEIAQGNLDLSSRTETQSANLEETASSMNELTATVRQNSERALEASNLANSASKAALHGGDVVKNVVNTMDAIKASSGKIVDIISVIDGIAFQTNILALNAAVEAARAGEQGRGFAVVASEVRNLAQRSASAAREIKELIQDSVGNIQSGATQVDEAGRAMHEIVQSIKQVTDIMSEIAHASKEQTHGIEQVNASIVEMEGVTQQNAALVEQAAAAAQSMQHQSRTLVEGVKAFRLD